MSSQASSDPAPIGAQSPGHPGGPLRAGALRIGDVVIMAMASSGPTQSIAVTLAVLLATVNYATFLPILICFIPMLGIAIGYQRLNAWQPSAGATYSWVGRALNPHAGFFAGWIMLMYYSMGTTSLTIPLGTYMLSFFSTAAANNTHGRAAVGTAFNLVVLVVAALGIKLSARFPWGWAIFEYGLLVGFSDRRHRPHLWSTCLHSVHVSTPGSPSAARADSGRWSRACCSPSSCTPAGTPPPTSARRSRATGRTGRDHKCWGAVRHLRRALSSPPGHRAKQGHAGNAANILAYVGHRIGGSSGNT